MTKASAMVEEFIDVDGRAVALGLDVPTGLCFLPLNLADAPTADSFLYESEITTLRVLFRQAGITETRLEPSGARIPVLSQKGIDLVLPTLFVAGALLTENPELVNVALGVVANYVTDFFRGMGGEKRVRFSIVVKDKATGSYKRFKYDGDPAGVREFARLATRIDNDSSN